MAFILTTPHGATSSIPGTSSSNITIPVGTSSSVDSVLWQYNIAVKWIVTLSADNNALITSYEILAHHKNGTYPRFTRYSTIGDKINHNIDVTISNDQLQLMIQNNEDINLLAYIVRIQTTT